MVLPLWVLFILSVDVRPVGGDPTEGIALYADDTLLFAEVFQIGMFSEREFDGLPKVITFSFTILPQHVIDQSLDMYPGHLSTVVLTYFGRAFII